MQKSFDVVISGFTLSGCLLAVSLSRVGISVCIIEELKTNLSNHKIIFYELIDLFGIVRPQWNYQWLSCKLSGKINPQKQLLEPFRGVVLDNHVLISSMLKDVRKHHATIIKDNSIKKIDSQNKRIVLADDESIGYKLLVLTEQCPYPMSDEFQYLVSIELEANSQSNPGIVEEKTLDNGHLMNISLGLGKGLILYSQPSLTNFNSNLSEGMAQCFKYLKINQNEIYPVKFDLRPVQKPFNNGMLCIGKAGRLYSSPWMLEGELEFILTRYCAEQIVLYFSSRDETSLYRINDYAERFIDYCIKKQGNI